MGFFNSVKYMTDDEKNEYIASGSVVIDEAIVTTDKNEIWVSDGTKWIGASL